MKIRLKNLIALTHKFTFTKNGQDNHRIPILRIGRALCIILSRQYNPIPKMKKQASIMGLLT